MKALQYMGIKWGKIIKHEQRTDKSVVQQWLSGALNYRGRVNILSMTSELQKLSTFSRRQILLFFPSHCSFLYHMQIAWQLVWVIRICQNNLGGSKFVVSLRNMQLLYLDQCWKAARVHLNVSRVWHWQELTLLHAPAQESGALVSQFARVIAQQLRFTAFFYVLNLEVVCVNRPNVIVLTFLRL